MTSLRVLVRIPILLIAVACVATSAGAVEVWTEPVYDPAAKSYFQLVTTGGAQTGITWGEAREHAQEKVFKGVAGRLAVIDTLEKHQFIRRHFDIDAPTFIGLRYWCEYAKLQWVNGKIHPFTAFSYWAPQWYRTDVERDSCIGGTMTVYYMPKEKGMMWQASGAPKKFEHFLVEYPTGAP